MDTTEHTNNRIEELEFLISVLSDLAHYKGHNENLLLELISNLNYRKDREELTTIAKSKSEEYLLHKQHLTQHR